MLISHFQVQLETVTNQVVAKAAFAEYEAHGGIEGLDEMAWEAQRYDHEYIEDEDGEIAHMRMLEAQSERWSSMENCPDWAM